MKYRLCFLSFFLIFFCLSSLTSHAQRFKAGLIVGANLAQIDGDGEAGFNKLGVQGGLRVAAVFTDRIELSTEMLFSQRGSRLQILFGNTTLNYVEVPLIFNYKDWLNEEDNFYKFHFYAGFSYGRLIGSKTTDIVWDPFLIQFRKNDVSWLAGATFYTNENLGFGARYTSFINKIYRPASTGPGLANALRGHFLTVQGIYMF